MTTLPRPAPHILVVNGRKVRNAVFVIGAPGAGTEMARDGPPDGQAARQALPEVADIAGAELRRVGYGS